MPSIFQGTCRACGHASESYSDVVLAILLERDHPAIRLPQNRDLVLDDVGELAEAGSSWRLLVLPHPCEDVTLETTGYSFERASREGRFVRLTPVACRACGTSYERRELTTAHGAAGCVAGVVVSVAVGVAVWLWTRRAPLGCGSAYLAVIGWVAVYWLVQRLGHLRFRGRARALARPAGCPTCGGRATQQLSSRRTLPCPACARRSFRFRHVGIS